MLNPGFHLTQILSQSRDLAKDPSQFINPHTGQSYTQNDVMKIIGDFVGEYEKGMAKKETVVKEELDLKMPKLEALPEALQSQPAAAMKGLKEFQVATQHFIRNVPLEFKVEYLNKIQKQCPNIIVDPHLRVAEPNVLSQLQYGLADVYRFMGLPLENVTISKFKSKKPLYRPKVMPAYTDVHGQLKTNPFYAPVSYTYPIPDVIGNNAMGQIMVNNPQSLFQQLRKLYYGMLQMKGGGNFDQVKDTMEKFYIKGNIKDMLSLIDHMLKKELDPLYLTNTLLSKSVNTLDPTDIMTPPMNTYFKDNMSSLMYQLLMAHRLYQIDAKPATNDLEITSPMMNEFMTSYHHYNNKPMTMVSSHYRPLGPKKSTTKSYQGPRRRRRKRKSRKRSSRK